MAPNALAPDVANMFLTPGNGDIVFFLDIRSQQTMVLSSRNGIKCTSKSVRKRLKFYLITPNRTKSLIHWGLMTHICVRALDKYWFIVNWTLGDVFQWNMNQNTKLAFENIVWETVTILSRPQCVKQEITKSFKWINMIYVHVILEPNARLSCFIPYAIFILDCFQYMRLIM